MEKKQLTQQELEELKNINARYAKLVTDLGECELLITSINGQMAKASKDKEELLADFASLKEKNDNLFASLTEKYGTGRIDLETGVIEEV
jgi:uncharacterized protein YdcH (DUF465 family)